MRKLLMIIAMLVFVCVAKSFADDNLIAPMVARPPIPEPISASLFLLGAGALGLKLFKK